MALKLGSVLLLVILKQVPVALVLQLPLSGSGIAPAFPAAASIANATIRARSFFMTGPPSRRMRARAFHSPDRASYGVKRRLSRSQVWLVWFTFSAKLK